MSWCPWGRYPLSSIGPTSAAHRGDARAGRTGTSVGSPRWQEPFDSLALFNEGDQPQAPTAPRTREDVKPETAAHQVGPWLSAPSSGVVPPCGTT